jgi:hypothetical protein
VGFLRKGYIAAGLLLGAAILPAIFMPLTLVFTSLLLIAGILAFFVKPDRASLPGKGKRARRRDED